MVTGMGKFKMGVDGTVTAMGGASLNLPVFAPAVYQNMKLTKKDILLAQEKSRGSRLDLINQVTKAYYGALLSSDSYEVMKRSYQVAKQNFDVVNEKFKVGRVMLPGNVYDIVITDAPNTLPRQTESFQNIKEF